ncbi:MAG: iron complex transport system substrate-binding protein [Clostridiales bacterium]|nr:iron complex transport system substrate-binding protein [Clostridiales bacterium]
MLKRDRKWHDCQGRRGIAFFLTVMLVLGLLCGCQAKASAETASKDGEETAVSAVAEPSAESNEGEAVAESEPASSVSNEASDSNEMVSFVDSVGRTVEVPTHITKVAISGPLTQIVVFSLAPDKLVGIANEWSKEAEPYFDPVYYNMPVLGQLYGGKGELNLETLLASGAQVVIDVGEPKDSITADLDMLQAQTGIPFVHITANLDNMGEAYRKLGELLDMPEEAEALATYCETIYGKTASIADGVEKVNLLYCLGDKGQHVIAKGSFHAQVFDLLANNAAVVDSPVSSGAGNEVDMEQIVNWQPDVIVFGPGSIYDTVGDDPAWATIPAIANGRYYEVPNVPYNWLGFPPSVQRYLGMIWMAELFYPEEADYDMYQEVAAYFKNFYHCDLSEAQYQTLMERAQ